MKVFILVLALVAGAFAACDSDPDHTNERLFYQTCGSGPFVVNSLAIKKDDGSTDYPVNVEADLTLVLNVTNTGTQTLDKITVSASIARYTDIFGICSWIGIPTFGLTDNLDCCNFGDTDICPMPPGTKVLTDKVNLKQFSAILNILSTSEPYRLTLTFMANGREVHCETVEAKITKG